VCAGAEQVVLLLVYTHILLNLGMGMGGYLERGTCYRGVNKEATTLFRSNGF